ncbi:MAG: hypothetical protein KF720_02105 [Rubrivivax sp.]|nr:hypothetical protein [Rubrivivax sp.]
MSVLRRAALSACGVAAVLSSGCAVAPAGPSVLVLPGPNATQARFQADQAACQQQAQAQVAPAVAAANNQAVATAAVGTAIGAAVGALVGYGSYGGYGGYGGYRHHYTNQSAAWGAGAGLMYGGAVGGSGSQAANLGLQQRYDNAFTQCMLLHGHQLPGLPSYRRAPPVAPPPPPPAGSPPAVPPPYTLPPVGVAAPG